MTHQMMITLTDAEYTALSREAAKDGKPLEVVLHEILAERIEPFSESHTLSNRQIQEYLYREGVIDHIPTGEPDSLEEEAERAHLASLFGQGKSASEMVIEDRGPR